MAPRLLDLFSGAGGCAVGYHRAGFDVVGVDIKPQLRYPYEHHVGDALEYLAEHGHEYDAIHASPTCQRKARVTAWRGRREDHPDTLTPILAALRRSAIPWVVENVPEASDEMRPDFLLCGTQFGLNVRRHRIFERGNWSGYQLLPPCQCYRNEALLPFEHKAERKFADAMGCDWMTKFEARQAIPPIYTQFIGEQLMVALTVGADRRAP